MKKQTGLQTKNSKVSNRPIGIFDSGLGGLTVAREIFRYLPGEDVVYFGDTARVPYGNKSKKTVTRFSLENCRFLQTKKVKLIIAACNTACSLSLTELTNEINVPLIGVVEPAAVKAVKVSKNGRIGVIGTKNTIKSKAYDKKIKSLNKNMRVFSESCPLFVPLVEEGWLNKETTYKIAEAYMGYLKKNRIDTLILGCTHYPLLKGVIQKVVGPEVRLVDSAGEAAKTAKAYLVANNLLKAGKQKASYVYYVSDEPQDFVKIGKRFLGRNIKEAKRACYEL